MITNPLSPATESYRHLRTALRSSGIGETAQTIVVSSPEPGDGKTTTVGNLAIAFARSGRRVLLVDADLRKPAVHSSFNLNLKPGLSNVLGRELSLENAVQRTDVYDLHVLTAGAIPSNPAEYLGSDIMRKLKQEMMERYDVVLFDSPPILAVSDAPILSTIVDRIILVVSSGRTRVDFLEHAVELLAGVGMKPSGVVLNNFNLHQAYGMRYKAGGYGYYGYAYKDYNRDGSRDGGAVKTRA